MLYRHDRKPLVFDPLGNTLQAPAESKQNSGDLNPRCSRLFSELCEVRGVKWGPGLRGPAKLPSSLMGNSIARLAPQQETKPIQTDEAQRHIGLVSRYESK